MSLDNELNHIPLGGGVVKYTQKAIMIVSETGKDSGNIPLVHGIYTSKVIASRELDKAKKLPVHLVKNVKQLEISFDFEI